MSKEQILYSLDGKRYKVSPFALYWNNGNYYLYAYVSDKEELTKGTLCIACCRLLIESNISIITIVTIVKSIFILRNNIDVA